MSGRKSEPKALIKPISVETGVLNPVERFDFLNDIYARERLILAPKQPLGNSINAGTTLWNLGDLRYALTHSSGHLGRRVKEKSSSYLAVRKHFNGGCHSWDEDGYFLTQPGDILITVNSVAGVHACNQLDSTNIAVPLDLVDINFDALKETHILRANTVGNRLLSIGMDSWTERLKTAMPHETPLLAKEIISLINHVLGTTFGDEVDSNIVSMRGQAMRKYIEENLFDEHLNVAQLCKIFGASRASVYREFENDGGVRRFASSLRLRKALMMLNEVGPQRGAVGNVANKVGYEDPLLFSRAFRKQFGFSPSDALSLSA